MNKINALIIDDERSNREFLAVVLADFCPQVNVVGEAEDVQSGIEMIRKHDPELVFLDIQMPNGTGFDLLEQFVPPRFQVIFVTAYDKYAIRSFKHSAVDYLLKPIDPEDLVKAVERAQQRTMQQEMTQNLQNLAHNLRNNDPSNRKLIVKDRQGLVVIRLDDVVRCEADGNYSVFRLTDGSKVTAAKPIKHFEEILEEKLFARIHNSHLVNLNHIVKYIKGRGGIVITSDGAELEVSRSKRDEFLRRLEAL